MMSPADALGIERITSDLVMARFADFLGMGFDQAGTLEVVKIPR
jgi:hypothetical protein